MLAVAVLLSPALALTPSADARRKLALKLPTHGIFVVGVKLAGVRLGFTQAQVTAVLGTNYTLCTRPTAATFARRSSSCTSTHAVSRSASR